MFSLRDLSKKVKIVKIKEVALNGVVYDFWIDCGLTEAKDVLIFLSVWSKKMMLNDI